MFTSENFRIVELYGYAGHCFMKFKFSLRLPSLKDADKGSCIMNLQNTFVTSETSLKIFPVNKYNL